MQLKVWGATDVGLRRKSNQDSFIVREDIQLFVVADGMGGHSGGEVASQIATQTIVAEIEKGLESALAPPVLMQQAYSASSKAIYTEGMSNGQKLKGMGTTMVSFWAKSGHCYIGNVGDSRAYLYRDKCLWQLTEDHSLVNEQLRAGLINEEQALHFQGKNIITRSVGFEQDVKADVLVRKPLVNDTFLLCSDGLCGLVEDEDILKILATTEGENVITRCINRAKDVGGDDNITVMMIKVIKAS